MNTRIVHFTRILKESYMRSLKTPHKSGCIGVA